MNDYTFILTRGSYFLDSEFLERNPKHKEEPVFVVRMRSRYVWDTAVRKAKEACLAYEKAEVAAGRLKFNRYYNIGHNHYRHFSGVRGHPSFIRIEV